MMGAVRLFRVYLDGAAGGWSRGPSGEIVVVVQSESVKWVQGDCVDLEEAVETRLLIVLTFSSSVLLRIESKMITVVLNSKMGVVRSCVTQSACLASPVQTRYTLKRNLTSISTPLSVCSPPEWYLKLSTARSRCQPFFLSPLLSACETFRSSSCLPSNFCFRLLDLHDGLIFSFLSFSFRSFSLSEVHWGRLISTPITSRLHRPKSTTVILGLVAGDPVSSSDLPLILEHGAYLPDIAMPLS